MASSDSAGAPTRSLPRSGTEEKSEDRHGIS
jgi:hypothetical protein